MYVSLQYLRNVYTITHNYYNSSNETRIIIINGSEESLHGSIEYFIFLHSLQLLVLVRNAWNYFLQRNKHSSQISRETIEYLIIYQYYKGERHFYTINGKPMLCICIYIS